MKQLRAGLRVTLQGLIELLLYFPIILVIAGFVLEDESISWYWLIALPLGYPVGYYLNLPISFRHPFPVVLLSLIGGALYGIGVFELSRVGILASLAAAFGLFRGGRMISMTWQERIGINRYSYGLLFYFLVSAIFLRLERFEDYSWVLLAGGATTLLLFFFLANRSMVGEETLSGDQEPVLETTVRRHNRLLVVIIAGLTVFIVLAMQLQSLLSAAWGIIVSWINRLLSGERGSDVPEKIADQPMQPPELPKGGEPSPIWDVLTYVFVVVISVLLIWLLIRIMKYVPGWLKLLRDSIARIFGRKRISRSQGYVDEVESIWKPGRLLEWFRGSPRQPRIKWKDLPDNESRMRFLYRQWLGQRVKAGYAYKPQLTPVETGLELSELSRAEDNEATRQLVNQYGTVRYGKKPISDAELERLLAATTLKIKHHQKRK
ncbi:DUF4129 domain-containing protein [Paenibacillus spongiae]|uniref:DUF4129 domain-containing protein n=1 Tax=Paenibacillus spongiae TaxID=2909671 RepID=A0ABY5S0V3_9BACL|nr:DUF4129 domain-containing protein [Paenibacillus spongiae]UVI27476.1 DUF4129 domain-containing protein [Paenibacillus spongiae]